MATVIPHVVNWSVTPQNGQEDYFTKMNVWLSESTNVIASLSTAITKINESNTESNDNLEEVLTARDQTIAARNEAVTAVATLTAGAIDDATIAANKAFSNQFITNNYYNKTDTYNKTEIDNITNINGFDNKSTPIDTDNLAIQETGGLFKKLSWANLKATLLTYFDTFYSRTTAIFGIGQTLQNLTSSRLGGVLYTNTTGKPITLMYANSTQGTITITVDGISTSYARAGTFNCIRIIPNNSTYSVNVSTTDANGWLELR